MKTDDALRHMAGDFLEVAATKFVDRGRKLFFFTQGDCSPGAYHLAVCTKYRFA